MTEAISMQLGGFLSIYLLLLVIAGIFTYCKIPADEISLAGHLTDDGAVNHCRIRVALHFPKPVTDFCLNLSVLDGRLCRDSNASQKSMA